jgi:hypothetical protein
MTFISTLPNPDEILVNDFSCISLPSEATPSAANGT